MIRISQSNRGISPWLSNKACKHSPVNTDAPSLRLPKAVSHQERTETMDTMNIEPAQAQQIQKLARSSLVKQLHQSAKTNSKEDDFHIYDFPKEHRLVVLRSALQTKTGPLCLQLIHRKTKAIQHIRYHPLRTISSLTQYQCIACKDIQFYPGQETRNLIATLLYTFEPYQELTDNELHGLQQPD